MKNTITTLCLVLGMITQVSAKTIDEVGKPSIAEQNNKFAFKLYNQIANKNEDGNIFISPFSISTALAMTYAGAKDETEKEMAKTMFFDENTEEFHLAYGAYIQKLLKNAEGNIEMKVANRLWGQETYEILKSFLEINQKAYQSPLVKLNFNKNPEASRLTINKWVADQTNQKILNLIPKGAIDETTLLVLTNAIYFKGDWKHEFDSTLTKKKDFTLLDGTIKKADFMYMKKRFNYSENEMFKAIRIPYKGDKQSMIIVLPHHAKNITVVQNEIGTATFNPLFNYSIPEVILHLPKFKATIPLTLNDYLKAMGMNLAFTDFAKFSKITKDNDIKISTVIHKAFIEIDEKGTEAAAATAVVMVTTSSVSHDRVEMPKVFDAKHPFLFYIVDNETKAILFMGRMMEPE